MIPDLSLTSWAGIAAAGAFIASGWRTILAGCRWVSDLIICRVMLKDDTARAVMAYAWSKGKRNPFGLRMFGGLTTFVAPKRRVEVVGYESVTSEPVLFWMGRVPMLISWGMTCKEHDRLNVGNQIGGPAMPTTLRFLRGTLNVETFIEAAITAYNQKRQMTDDATRRPKRFNVIRMTGPVRGEHELSMKGSGSESPNSISGTASDFLIQLQRGEMRTLTWKPEDLVELGSSEKPFTHHPVAPDIMAAFDDIGGWLKHENWFRSRGVPWRRGFLIHSPPGAGKDTLIRNLAIQHDLPIYAFDLSTYDNRSFPDAYRAVMQNAPAIALISDIDAVFKGRENVAVKDKQREGLTFDCLLNTLSGITTSEGVLLFITTNHIESLDPALGQPRNGDHKSTRPGRIDKVIEMGAMQERERRLLAQHVLSDWPDQIEPTVVAGEGEMAAQFQERCAQVALKAYWERGLTSEVVPVAARAVDESARREDDSKWADEQALMRARRFMQAKSL
jgi:hypothetical protein